MTGTDRQDLIGTTVGIEAHRERMTVEVVRKNSPSPSRSSGTESTKSMRTENLIREIDEESKREKTNPNLQIFMRNENNDSPKLSVEVIVDRHSKYRR